MTDKPTRELTIASATRKLIAIRRSIPDELAAAKQKVLDDAAAREAKVLERVHEEARGIVRREADKGCPAEPAAVPDVEYEHPDVADEPTPEPAVDDVSAPRGTTDYVPGPVAQAARRGR